MNLEGSAAFLQHSLSHSPFKIIDPSHSILVVSTYYQIADSEMLWCRIYTGVANFVSLLASNLVIPERIFCPHMSFQICYLTLSMLLDTVVIKACN